MEWPNNIKKRREFLHFKQKDIADKIGISTVTLSRYENGIRQPKIDILQKTAKVLNTTVEYLSNVNLQTSENNTYDNKFASEQKQHNTKSTDPFDYISAKTIVSYLCDRIKQDAAQMDEETRKRIQDDLAECQSNLENYSRLKITA